MADLSRVVWRKSSRSQQGGNCVEVGATQETVGVRDTKDRRSGMLEIDRVAWTAFVRALKEDRLDV